jgi:hypothetical protein
MSFVRRGWLALAVAVALAAAFGRQQFGTHNTPPGQPALAHISGDSIDALRVDFNKAADAVRLVVLLSPT